MSITLKEIAKLAGVSPSTVSRVIRDDKRISEKTKDKVIKYIEQLGYKTPGLARLNQAKNTYTIGFVIPDIAESFFMTVAASIDKKLTENNYTLIICGTNNDFGCEKKRIEFLRRRQLQCALQAEGTFVLRSHHLVYRSSRRWLPCG